MTPSLEARLAALEGAVNEYGQLGAPASHFLLAALKRAVEGLKDAAEWADCDDTNGNAGSTGLEALAEIDAMAREGDGG